MIKLCRVGPKQKQQGRDCYEHFTIWGEDAGPEHVFDHKSKMFFPKDHHKNAVCNRIGIICAQCSNYTDKYNVHMSV